MMNEYQVKAMAVSKEIEAELELICSAMGPEWRVDYPEQEAGEYRIARTISDGKDTIWIHTEWNKKERFAIGSAGYPSYINEFGRAERVSESSTWQPKEAPIRITVARNRGAEAIAKSIKSRFLPEHQRVMAHLKTLAKEKQAYSDKHNNAGQRVAAACGQPFREGRQTYYPRGLDDVRVEYDGPAYVTLRMSADQAVSAIEYLNR